MTVAETLELARSYGVEVRLNAAGSGLDLEIEADPPPALVKVLRRAKWDIVSALRQQQALADLLERRRPLLETVEDSRPPDAPNDQWQTALRGLRTFLAAGHGDAAEAMGWPHNELYAVPPVWARVDLCGAALLIGDSEVVEITSTRIGIRTSSGAPQAFYKRPEFDIALAYSARIKSIGLDATKEEPRLRAREAVVLAYQAHCRCDFETAKKMVLQALANAKT
jgi:hypothetical protein